MRIKKTSQYIEGGASLSNVYGNSNENGYTQEYINSKLSGLVKSFTYTGTTNTFGNLTTNVSATNKVPVFVNIGQTNSYSMYANSGYLGVKIPDSPNISFTITYYYIDLTPDTTQNTRSISNDEVVEEDNR